MILRTFLRHGQISSTKGKETQARLHRGLARNEINTLKHKPSGKSKILEITKLQTCIMHGATEIPARAGLFVIGHFTSRYVLFAGQSRWLLLLNLSSTDVHDNGDVSCLASAGKKGGHRLTVSIAGSAGEKLVDSAESVRALMGALRRISFLFACKQRLYLCLCHVASLRDGNRRSALMDHRPLSTLRLCYTLVARRDGRVSASTI